MAIHDKTDPQEGFPKLHIPKPKEQDTNPAPDRDIQELIDFHLKPELMTFSALTDIDDL